MYWVHVTVVLICNINTLSFRGITCPSVNVYLQDNLSQRLLII